MTTVADSSPLIALASISAFQVLQPLFTEILIPESVHREVVLQGSGRPGQEEILSSPWIGVHVVGEFAKVDALCRRFRIRGGEAEAIVLGLELGARWLLMDERVGRQAAMATGIEPDHIIGTLGILLAAKERGLIAEVSGKMAELQERGFRIDPALYRLVQRQAGEVG